MGRQITMVLLDGWMLKEEIARPPQGVHVRITDFPDGERQKLFIETLQTTSDSLLITPTTYLVHLNMIQDNFPGYVYH